MALEETISKLAGEILVKLIKDCPDGLGNHRFDRDNIKEYFPNSELKNIDEGISKLELSKMLRVRHYIGGLSVSLTLNAYKQLDYNFMNFDTVSDAVVIAKDILELNIGNAKILHDRTGWQIRRFNPAFSYLVESFPEGRISQEIQSKYYSVQVLVEPEDRVRLNRFIENNMRG